MISLLVLNLPPGLEEDLIDYLLKMDSVSGFTSYRAMGHGAHEHLTAAEQVAGRRKRVQFEIIMETDSIPGLTAGLAEQVGKDITFWEQPVNGVGRT